MGRKTYDMMAAFWPTPMAEKSNPHMANVMNNSRKIVFSRSMQKAEEKQNWRNVILYKEIIPGRS
jgi:dihydrofolate reductase